MATESVKEQPQLLAFVICEKVVFDGEIPIIWRAIDNFSFVLALPEGVDPQILDSWAVQLKCEVFTKWGPPGEGEYKAELGLMVPDGNEVQRNSQTLVMTGGYAFSQIVWSIGLGLVSGGIYQWVLYVDGEEVARHPFRVNITRQTPQTPEAK